MKKYEDILNQAQSIAAQVSSWADLANPLFDPYTGIIPRAFPKRTDRSLFMKSPEYKKIKKLVSDAKRKFGLAEGATPTASGKFVVRVPKSLHESLKAEASKEGVSLNQLVVCKLSTALRTSLTA